MEALSQNQDIREELARFLDFRPEISVPVLSLFAELDGAVFVFDGGKHNFVYVPGTRQDRVALVAHADTVWDSFYLRELPPYTDPAMAEALPRMEHRPVFTDGRFRQGGWTGWGLGADDRAGCAMLWLLRNSGHSLLVTDGEEHGQIGSHYLTDYYPEISEELNGHCYILQLDRKGRGDYKTYSLPVSPAFRRFIHERTGYSDAGKLARTDIVALCTEVCGVNLSIGYHMEHSPDEYLDLGEWTHTYELVRRMLEGPQTRFPLMK